MEILFFFTGLIIGSFGLWLIFKFKSKASIEIFEEQAKRLQNDLDVTRNALTEKEEKIIELNKQIAAKEADYKNLNEKLLEQKNDIEKIQEKFKEGFKNLANEILEEKTKKFTEQNKSNLDEILKPLKEKIKDFEKKVEDTYDKETQQRISLKEEVKNLTKLNEQLSKDANNLAKALKGDSKTQGNWGEIILENILERSGLVKEREYFIQTSYQDNNGNRFQPDVIVKYPGERSIIIDSKVSLTAYDRYSSSDTEIEKERSLKEHMQSIKSHINELAQKNYQDIYQIKSLDFIMMFLPVEPAYLLAIQNDQDLWNYAYDKRILLISPTNLIGALKLIVSLWRQEYQNKNAMEIAQKSGDLYDKFVGFLEDLEDIGKKLKSTQNSYDASMNKLHSGKGSLVKRVENIRELGAKTRKKIPDKLLDGIEDNTNQ